MELLHKALTDKILEVYYHVYNQLGYGFLEKVYQNSMQLEMISRGLEVEAQKQIKVYFKDVVVGTYYADLLVNDCIIIEIKAAEFIIPDLLTSRKLK